MLLALSACTATEPAQPTPDAARRFLQLRGYEFNDQSFFRAAAAGDAMAVNGFITAGIDPNVFLPAKRNYYSYAGSLTTPPCAETVAWMLLAEPIQVAEADIAAFAKLYPMNARPVQKDFRRFVLRS